MKRPVRHAVTAALLPLLLLACSDDGGGDADGASGSDDAASESNGGDSNASVEDVDVEDVVAEQTVALPRSPDDELTIGVHSLTVDGDVMILRLVVTPDFSSVADDDDLSLFDAWGRTGFRPSLLDTENLKEYSIIENGAWAADATEVATTNGEPMLAWAYYAAPEDDIDTIDIRVSDAWPSFLDVPITR